MKRFFSFIIRQSAAIILAVIFALAFGIYCALNMSVNLLPDINVPMVCAQVIYAGANAKSVEKDVTVKLEDGLSSMRGVNDVSSYSYDNVSAVILSFDYGTDTKEKKNEISSKIATLDLPDGVVVSVYDIDLNAEALAVLSVTSSLGGNDDEKLKNAYGGAEELAAKISAIDGVENVEIKGGPQTSYVIKPIGGLELIAPLIVQAFSYGQLDLPLGNVWEEGGNVQIRNNSDVTEEDDILNMPITLPAQMVTLLTSVNTAMSAYEQSSAQDLKTLKDDMGTGVITVLGELDEMSYNDVQKLSTLKTYMTVASDFTADTLSSFRASSAYNSVYNAVTKEVGGVRVPKTDAEVEELTDELKESYPLFSRFITVDMLKAVRDGKIDDIINFRREYLEVKQDYSGNAFYELTLPDYYVLETEYVKIYADEFDYSAPENVTAEQKKVIENRISFADKVTTAGLSVIADGKRTAEQNGESYSPTDAECALLFMGTRLFISHPIIASPSFIALVRSDNFEENMAVLIEKREKFYNENVVDEVESPLTAKQYFEVYSALNLDGIFEYKISEELLGFTLENNANFSSGDFITTVGEIAKVERQDEFSSYVYVGSGGEASVVKGTVIEVYKSNGANSSAVVDAVKAAYAAFLQDSGKAFGIGENDIKLLDDQSEFISDSISNVLISILIGGLLAVFIIFIFLKKVRTSLIIAITMPLSVLAAIICLFLMGITLNMVSLGGLAVGIGMLVDNSIVVIESISKHRDMDKSAFEAAVDGTTEVGGALFGSTLTTVCVFIPIIFSGGLTGEIFTDLSWAVIFSLTFSLIVAVSVIPALYAMFSGKKRMLKGKRLSAATFNADAPATEKISENTEVAEEKIFDTEERTPADMPRSTRIKGKFACAGAFIKSGAVMTAVANGYGKILPKVLNKKLVTILCAVAVFGASIGLLFLTGTEFLPSIDKGQIEIDMSYGAGVDLETTERDVYGFTEEVRKELGDGLDYISVSVGKNGMLALTDTGIITVQLKSNRGTDKVVEQIRTVAANYGKDKNLNRNVTVRQIDGVVASLMSGADDMSVTVVGEDREVLREISEEICARLQSEENGFTDVKNGATDSAKEYDLHFDRLAMLEQGLDYQTLIITLRIGIAGYTACTATIGGETLNINVKFNDSAITGVEDLKNFVVGADGNGNAIKLQDICEIEETEAEACIRRSNGKQMVSVSAAKPGVDTGTASKQMQKIAAEVLTEYEGYTFESSGISSYLTDAFTGLAVALVISFFLLFAVMAVQFSSFVKPLIVMASIPFSFTGGFIALVITGTSLNVVSFIGLIMLMGVVVNNAIVMLEKIKQLCAEGVRHYDAVQQACKVRLRPILMTTLTTILALVPLAIGVGQGSELMQPLGIVVIGGLLIGTLVTLALVPAVYCAVHGLSAKKPWGRKPPKEDSENCD